MKENLNNKIKLRKLHNPHIKAGQRISINKKPIIITSEKMVKRFKKYL